MIRSLHWKTAFLSLVAASLTTGLAEEAAFLSQTRQLTLEGRRAGEGYFSADGKRMIFQSERDPANPFFQIFVLDLESGDVNRVSPGTGKSTCAWLHPDGKRVMFASTHEDAAAKEKQETELKQRAEGKMKRYSWDYDETFDIYEAALDGSGLRNVTHTRGYDAEGCFSPDGQWIVFASNRQAYEKPLGDADKARLENDKQFFMEIYRMKADGTGVQRLTDVAGYDGGPFFSADGKRICWRRFNEGGDKAEIWSMNADGSDQKQLTRLGAMSWAPFFHPSGQYLIFATNLHGFDNFELYLVDADGRREPVRVTDTAGFDGLPTFSPDGKKLSWTSNRTPDKTSQLFLAEWNHAAALKALGLTENAAAPVSAAPTAASTSADITVDDLKQHIGYLASDALEGRLTGTPGEKLATDYVAKLFESFGLQPAGENGTWFQSFDFTAGVELGPNNAMTVGHDSPVVRRDWVPLSFSWIGSVPATPAVFAGYGIELPEENGKPGYSSYFHLDVKDKWVVVLRYQPEGVTGDQRGKFIQRSSLRYKAMTARQHGAKGIVFVSGPNSKVREQLIPLSFDASLADSGLAVLSATDALAAGWLKAAGKDLKALQDELDKGEPVQGFEIGGLQLAATIDLKQERRTGRNVLGRLPATGTPAGNPVLIGAHVDHLGREYGGASRATEAEKGQIHHGADDNASGTAGMLEIAQSLGSQKAAGAFQPKRDLLFAAWSGEEAGLLGSAAFMKSLEARAPKNPDPHAEQPALLGAVLNLDMIGRLDKTLVLQGLGSSDWWKPAIEKRNVPVGLPLTLQADCFAPTDTTTFYPKRIPILNAFTGNHEDYHRPTDTADKVNYEAAAKVSRLFALIGRDLATADAVPTWKEYKSSDQQGQRAAMRVYLGTIPDYSQGDIAGVKLTGVSPVGPAAKAGVLGGDVIVALGGKEIKNIYDYTFVLGELKVGQETEILVLREGKKVALRIVPVSRD